MKLWNNTLILWILALISSVGIIMMLILDGIWDWIMLMVTILPILIAIYRLNRR